MSDIPLSKLVGGMGGFAPTIILTPQSVAAGATGDIITITPPSGKRAALLGLAVAGNNDEADVTISFSGEQVISGELKGVFQAAHSSGFKIGLSMYSNASTSSGSSTIDMLVTPEADQVITVNKSDGDTANAIRYIVAYGD